MKELIISILLLVLLGCGEADFYKGDYSAYKSEKSLNTDIEFFPSETYFSYDEGEPSLKLQFYTTDSYPCINYAINLSTYYEDDNELIVRFEGVSIGGICATAIGPASSQVDLPEDIERLILINGDKVDVYGVEITKEFVKLTKLSRSFTGLRYAKIFRYPENSFVYSCKNDDKHLALYNAFLDSLTNNITISEFVFDGEGRIPYAENSENEVAKYFIYENEADFHKAGEIFKQYLNEKTKKDDYIYIELINWKNEKYLSWMLYE